MRLTASITLELTIPETFIDQMKRQGRIDHEGNRRDLDQNTEQDQAYVRIRFKRMVRRRFHSLLD